MPLAHLWPKRSSDDLLPDGTHEHSTTVNELQREAYLWIGVIDIFLFSVSTLLFVYRGRRTLDINAHAVLLTSIGSFTILVVNTCFLFQFVWPGHFPCFIILWCAYPGVMLWMSCTMARALRLYILSYRNMQKLKERNKAGQMTAAQLYGRGAMQDADADADVEPADRGANVDGAADARRAEPRRRWLYRLPLASRCLARLDRWWTHEKMQITERRLVWYTVGATLFAAVVCSIIQALTKDLSIVPMRYSRCPVGVWEYFPLYALTALYCVILTPIIVYHIWPIKDAFGIRHDILLNNLFTFVCIAMFMVQTNKGFGGHDPFWDSFLWCALLFNMSQFTSVIIPLVRSYRQSDAFTWSDNSSKSASKELFYRVLNHPELFEKLKVYSAANFCTEITLFLEEYQVLKANTVRFYNIGEPGFDDDGAADEDDDLDDDAVNSSTGVMAAAASPSRPNLATIGNSLSIWTATAATNTAAGIGGAAPGSRNAAAALNEKDALRLHLSSSNAGSGSKHLDLESNPDTIISVGDGGSMSEIDYSDKAAMVSQPRPSRSNGGDIYSEIDIDGDFGHHDAGLANTNDSTLSAGAGAGAANGVGSSKFGGLMRVFGKAGSSTLPGAADGVQRVEKASNTATLAVGGAAIGNLPERRNSRGEDIMVISRIPPFTPVRYTVLSTLMQTPAGLTRQGNLTTFKTLPFALRGDYYGFYSTFIADGATLQINVEGRISEGITRLIHSQQYTVDMMDEAHSEVLQLLYDNIFKKFVRLYHRDMSTIM
ncbi:hypothetical protein H4R99_000448 [Coemansia sp. RSA 1722]|nr:hypothetical protein IWW45_001805 [Coemansia sp. RSA 485]KAJ2599329.1 hypothetical protein GGF39_002280 [Coemansia sp. RSA 1721]KAJ2606427.1 hypothetical protein H4R99_000448 [Coemansia sp. RSA 1722]KAJ2637309.1 hypothetical protein GGF40_002446 [Coemansia sp. RSA 1286]